MLLQSDACCAQLRFTMTAVRSSICKKMPGGMSYFVAQLLQHFNDSAADLAHGVLLSSEEGSIVLVCKFGCLVADESALKHMYACKGASGNLACMMCRNVVLERSGCLHAHSMYLLWKPFAYTACSACFLSFPSCCMVLRARSRMFCM